MNIANPRNRHDITCAGVIDASRRFCDADFPALFDQSLGLTHRPEKDLPFGFALHQEAIHYDVILCIQDIASIQRIIATEAVEPVAVDNIRALIASRLVLLQQPSQTLGPVAECCRLAACIVCYICYQAAWKDYFVSVRLSEKLLLVLDDTIPSDIWSCRPDLLLWLGFVGSSASRANLQSTCPTEPQYQDILERVLQWAETWDDRQEGKLILETMKAGFIYADNWINQRYMIPYWADLERLISERQSPDEERAQC